MRSFGFRVSGLGLRGGRVEHVERVDFDAEAQSGLRVWPWRGGEGENGGLCRRTENAIVRRMKSACECLCGKGAMTEWVVSV
jgi:hypothetical protein